MSKHTVLLEGTFDKRVKTYWLLGTPIAFACSIVLIPLIPVYLIIASLFVDKYIANLRCTLTERTLVIKKGILNKVESTIPLEKITDLQMYQGPIMRHLGVKGFRVETAGQSSGPGGHLVNMIGIVDTDGFREAVLAQRDSLDDRKASRQASHDDQPPEELAQLAREIRDTLARIEQKLTGPR